MPISYLSLGSNIDDRVGYIQKAVKLLTLDKKIKIIRTSSLYETQAWGNENLDWFINAAIEIHTELTPDDLLKTCFNVEKRLGRTRVEKHKYSSRTIDIDILFYGDLIKKEENLIIPHPLLHKRAFVLIPLMELIPSFKHPIYKETIETLYYKIEEPQDVFLYATKN